MVQFFQINILNNKPFLEFHSFAVVLQVVGHYHDDGENKDPFVRSSEDISPCRGSMGTSVHTLDELAQVPNLYRFFNLVFQCLTLFDRVAKVAVLSTLPRRINVFWAL